MTLSILKGLKMNKTFIVIFTVLFSAFSYAQQDAQYTQYMYNTVSVNPAYAGSRGLFSATGLYRSQWVGFDGAPTTMTFTFNSPISKNVGLGMSIVQDEIGPSTEQHFFVDFSYTITTSEKGKLAFGIKGGAHILDVDFTKVGGSQGDVKFENNIDNRFSPNVGAGAYYFTDKFYLGLSAPNLLATEHFEKASLNSNTQQVSYLATERTNLYLIAGYVFDLGATTKLKPAALIKSVQGAPLQVDLSANFLFNNKIRLGAAYRWSAAMSFLAGFQLSDGLLLGYAYDIDTTDLSNYNSGSHELFLRYELFKERGKTISPRFF
jgi:type IX secretion system PorP/SprF family membrane protein